MELCSCARGGGDGANRRRYLRASGWAQLRGWVRAHRSSGGPAWQFEHRCTSVRIKTWCFCMVHINRKVGEL